MKLFNIMMTVLAGTFMVSGATAQIIPQTTANASINVLTANSGQVKLGQTVFLQVDISNTGPNSIQAYRIKVQVAAPTALVNINNATSILPSGWAITSGGGTSGAINLSNGTDVIPNGETRILKIALVGSTVGAPQTLSGQLSFSNGNAPGTAPGSLFGNSTADDNSTSTIEVRPAPACSLVVTASAKKITCNGGTTTLSATATGAAGTVEYSLNGGSFQAGNTFTIDAAGSPYVVTAREVDSKTCIATAAPITVTQASAIKASASAGLISCYGGTTILTVKASGGTKPYQYSINGGSFQAGNTFLVNATGSPYFVTVKDTKNCIGTTPALSVAQPAVIVVVPVIISGSVQTIAVSATGGTGVKKYVISTGPVINSTGAISGVFAGLTGGTYTFTATDSNGCKSTSGPIGLKIPPNVYLTAPVNNSTYPSGAGISLKAAASDADGQVVKVAFYNGKTLLYTATDTPYTFKWDNVLNGNYTLTVKATDNDNLTTTSDSIHISVVSNKPPTVNITSPKNGQSFVKDATIRLSANATDADGTIAKVEFYRGTTLLATDNAIPYEFNWKNAQPGSYSITAKATDNWGGSATSAVIKISVSSNQRPIVRIIKPSNGKTFVAPATINFEAVAQDADGRIIQVRFYNGKTLLPGNQNKAPYTYKWTNVPAGMYSIAAIAKDDQGKETASAPISIKVTSAGEQIAGNRETDVNIKTGKIITEVTMRLSPNPVSNVLNINTTGLDKSKKLMISVISSSGALVKANETVSSGGTTQLDVSLLARGIYTIKVVSSDNTIYKRFVKL